MPTINIPPTVRFVLYIISAIALLGVSYAVDKSWAGDPEVRFVTGLAALLQLLAAAKTNLRDEPKVIERGEVKVATPEADEAGFLRLPFTGASRDRSLPGKRRIHARRQSRP